MHQGRERLSAAASKFGSCSDPFFVSTPSTFYEGERSCGKLCLSLFVSSLFLRLARSGAASADREKQRLRKLRRMALSRPLPCHKWPTDGGAPNIMFSRRGSFVWCAQRIVSSLFQQNQTEVLSAKAGRFAAAQVLRLAVPFGERALKAGAPQQRGMPTILADATMVL